MKISSVSAKAFLFIILIFGQTYIYCAQRHFFKRVLTVVPIVAAARKCCDKRNLIARNLDISSSKIFGDKISTMFQDGLIHCECEAAKSEIVTSGSSNIYNDQSKHLLYLVNSGASKESCLCLIENGADINIVDEKGNSLLILAILRGNKELVDLFIEKNINVNHQNTWGRTALQYSVLDNNKEICKFLLDNGADVNAQERDGYSALHDAAYHKNKEICELLISRGAIIDIENIYGRIPWDYIKNYEGLISAKLFSEMRKIFKK